MSIIKGTDKIVAGFGGTKRSIGEVYFSQSSLASDNSGALPLFTGETIASANTIYPDFYNWVLSHTELQCTSTEYESALSTYGECAKYVIGGGSLRLPLIKNYIKAANPAEGIKNIEAGLPNITGSVGGVDVTAQYVEPNGAFSQGTSQENGVGFTNNAYHKASAVNLDASRSSSIYGKSSTVTPASTTLYPWVVAYTAAIPASTAQAAEFQQGLSGKADTNLSNLSTAGKDLASGLSMPSSRYIDLTLGASGSTYTAPANGYFQLAVLSGKSIQFYNQTRGNFWKASIGADQAFAETIACQKGDTIQCYHTYTTFRWFRFFYAEGAE